MALSHTSIHVLVYAAAIRKVICYPFQYWWLINVPPRLTIKNHWGCRRVLKIAKSDNQLRHVYLSVCPSIDFHWADVHEIWYLGIFQNSIYKIQVVLKSDKNNGYFAWTCNCVFNNISLGSSKNEKCFRQKLYSKWNSINVFPKIVLFMR
jgi:hypothetical protein